MLKAAKKKVMLFFIVLGIGLFIWQVMAFIQPTTPGQEFSLVPPGFVTAAEASVQAPAVQELTEEAGISAYLNAETSINLDQVKSVFRTIETETSV